MCLCADKVLFKQTTCFFSLSLHILIYMCVPKNIKLKPKDLIYQNMLINGTVVNAKFMDNTKRPKKVLCHCALFLKMIEGKILSGGKMKLYCKRNECKQWHLSGEET